MSNTSPTYIPHRTGTVEHIRIRTDVPYRLLRWKSQNNITLNAPPLLMLHGWMDIGASFQRCVDELGSPREIIALDWRGFGGSRPAQPKDSYWFYDYYADLDAIIDHLSPDGPIDLLGHSMGANIAMIYAGTCPERVRRLVNVEGYGLPRTLPSEAPDRLARWLSELKTPTSLRTFADVQEIVDHLTKRSPHIEQGFATWLAQQWTERKDDGRWHVAADPIHKRTNPILYQCDEVLASWENITAKVLWAEGDKADQTILREDRYPRQEFETRISKVKSLERVQYKDCGHMVHLDQPGLLARTVERFLSN